MAGRRRAERAVEPRSRSTRCISARGCGCRRTATARSRYRELADKLVPYVRDLGFTHVEFLPVMEHPFYGSWGYQTTGYFAPTSRYGTPQDFMYLVDQLHQRGHRRDPGLGALALPDRRARPGVLRRHAPVRARRPAQGFPPRLEQLDLQLRAARGALVPALVGVPVAGRVPRRRAARGRRGVDALPRLLPQARASGFPTGSAATRTWRRWTSSGASTRPSTSATRTSRPSPRSPPRGPWSRGPPTSAGWASGSSGTWAGCTTRSRTCREDPIHRRFHHNDLTFRSLYAFTENFCLPLSHDEVVHGKGSLLGKMPGDDWQKFANLRALLAYMYTQPGKKLLFMGGEIAPARGVEPRVQRGVAPARARAAPGRAAARPRSQPVCSAASRALHELDTDPAGMEWIDANDSDNSVLTYLRKSRDGKDVIVVVCNFTPVPRLRLPRRGAARGVLARGAQHRRRASTAAAASATWAAVRHDPHPLPRTRAVAQPRPAAPGGGGPEVGDGVSDGRERR